MIQILYHPKFIKEFKKLPLNIKEKLISLEILLKENEFHPSLHTKKLSGKLKHMYSFRITREYRVIFNYTSFDEVMFLSVRHRKDIYK